MPMDEKFCVVIITMSTEAEVAAVNSAFDHLVRQGVDVRRLREAERELVRFYAGDDLH
jgi:hypothetical protein